VTVGLLALGASPPAHAQDQGARCVYVPQTRELFVIIKRIPPSAGKTGAKEPEGEAVIGRYDDELAVLGGADEHRVSCSGGAPTVSNTDTIEVRRTAGVASAQLGIDLRQGLLAPGATPEADGTPEIELGANLGRRGVVVIAMTTGPDQVWLGKAGGEEAAELNGIEQIPDVDLTAGRSAFIVYGGLGDDLLTADPTDGGTLLGGPGDDLLAGGVRTDLIQGDRGDDLIAGGGGADVILGYDRNVDRIDCGAGDDRSVYVDPTDELVGCEDPRFSNPVRMRYSSHTGSSTVSERAITFPIASPVP
jgi:Ca2+-binding RTX toxin-like protein